MAATVGFRRFEFVSKTCKTFSRLSNIFSKLKNGEKELSFCHKLRFANSYSLEIRFPRPLIFQPINSGRSNSLSLKYQRSTPSGCKDIGVRKFKFVAKTQFLSTTNQYTGFNKCLIDLIA